MVLHICIEGVESENKRSILQELNTYLTKHKHKYKVTYIELPVNEEVLSLMANHQLTNHEIALLMAFDYTHQYQNTNFQEYDFVIWQRGTITSKVYNTDKNTPPTFIKQINKYTPIMDLTLIIPPTTKKQNKYHEKYLQEIDEKKGIHLAQNMKEIKQLLEQELPKCNWCGKYFKPTQTHRKYCCKNCSEASLEEQYRINNREYYKKYKNVLTERQRGALGSKNANLHGKADTNPLAELEKVRNAKKSLGLKPIQ